MGYADIPVPVDKLDPHRVTVYQDDHGHLSSVTDNFKEAIKGNGHHEVLPRRWRGMTIFQINADTRKELGMVSSSSAANQRPQTAKKVAQREKVQLKRQVKRQKGQDSLSVSEEHDP